MEGHQAAVARSSKHHCGSFRSLRRYQRVPRTCRIFAVRKRVRSCICELRSGVHLVVSPAEGDSRESRERTGSATQPHACRLSSAGPALIPDPRITPTRGSEWMQLPPIDKETAIKKRRNGVERQAGGAHPYAPQDVHSPERLCLVRVGICVK